MRLAGDVKRMVGLDEAGMRAKRGAQCLHPKS